MGRAERRKAEKQERDAQWRDLPNWERKFVARVQQVGITPDDVKAAGERGFKQGYENGSLDAMRSAYAAALLTVQEMFGVTDHEKGVEFLTAMDEKVIYSLTSQELIDEAFEKAHVQIHFKNTLDRIEEV